MLHEGKKVNLTTGLDKGFNIWGGVGVGEGGRERMIDVQDKIIV